MQIRVMSEAIRRLEMLGLSAEEVFERGARSYLEQPKVKKLAMEGSAKERLENLVLMLAQTRASYEVLELWQATEGHEYASGRDEYTDLAGELEKMEKQTVRPLRDEIEALAREVALLEEELRRRGGDLDRIEPPFPKSVTRPVLEMEAPEEPRGFFGSLWHRLTSR
ncbi:hypothetical protein [Rubrobacter calidifluminis]|uniref:hypothetical protein n=1 Tax=Rubrobacter calidifluminis TaxID=1392640 RepID=UPI00235EFE04|nr:hypothetical protein [Rubrobacter calidifluminis]